jgi:4-aminobutyrate aminotransferase
VVLSVVVESAKDCIVTDVNGNNYVEFNSGVAYLDVGHSHPEVVDDIKNQCDQFLHYSNTDLYHSEVIDLVEKLIHVAPGDFEKKVYFDNSGTDAMEAAIKLARCSHRKPKFMFFIGAIYGRTLGFLSFTASKTTQWKRKPNDAV